MHIAFDLMIETLLSFVGKVLGGRRNNPSTCNESLFGWFFSSSCWGKKARNQKLKTQC